MKHSLITRASTALAFFSAAASAMAHDGHGLQAIHWHATDTLGFLVVAVLAGAAVWFSRGGK